MINLFLASKNCWSSCRSFHTHFSMGRQPSGFVDLLQYLGDGACSDGPAALADGEAQTLLHGHWSVQRDLQLDVVAGHAHLRACRQLRRTRHVRRAEVELRTVAVEQRSVTSDLFLRQHVDLALEVGMRLDGSRLGQYHAALYIFLRDTAQKKSGVVACQTLVQLLLEHLDASDNRL